MRWSVSAYRDWDDKTSGKKEALSCVCERERGGRGWGGKRRGERGNVVAGPSVFPR